MRMGLVISSLLHATLVGLGIFTIGGSQFERHELDIEPVSVDLVTIADTMSLHEGSKKASSEEAPAPKPTQKPEINNQAKHVGDGKVDSAAPLKLKERPRDVEAPPPPSAPEQTNMTAETPEKIEATKPQENQAAPVESAPSNTTIVQTPPEVPPEETSEEVADIAAVDTAVVMPPLPQNIPRPKRKPKPTPPEPVRQQQAAAAATPPPQPRGEESLDDILEKSANLIDRTPTQGGGMRRSQQPDGAGAARNLGDNQQLAQTIQNVIGGCIKEKANIGILIGSQSRDLVVRVHLRLNRDGSIDGVPDLTPSGGEASEREIATTQGYAALARCAPFLGLPPERYDDGWFDVTINWRPLERF